MLKTQSVQELPSDYSLRVRKKAEDAAFCFEGIPMMADADDLYDDDGEGDEGDGNAKGRSKSRRELPAGAVATLKAWLLSPEHFTHPYPTPQDQAMLMQKTGIDKKQLKNWFTNARRRIWKPMLKKQIEQGKLATSGAPGLMLTTMPGGVPTMSGSMDNPHSVQAMRVHYQQVVQQQQDSLQQQQQQQQQVRRLQNSIHPFTVMSHPSHASLMYIFHNHLAASATRPSAFLRLLWKRRLLFGTVRDGFVFCFFAATAESARFFTKPPDYQRIHWYAAAAILKCPAKQDGQSRGAHGVVCARSGSGATSYRICPAQGGKQTTTTCCCSIVVSRRRRSTASLEPASNEGSFAFAGWYHCSCAHAKLLATLFKHHVPQQPRNHAGSQEHCELEWG